MYFIGAPNGQRIKIGYSAKDDWSRLDDHAEGDAFGSGGNYTILAVVRATRHAESQLKNYFRPYLVAKREVYRAEPLLPYITWLRDQYFVSIAETEFYSECGRTVIEASAWLPADGRQSERRAELSLFDLGDPWAVLPSRDITGDDWYTPGHIVECVREALGEIDLDPASHVGCNHKYIRARRFFTLAQNGLTQPWSGRVFLNPPFSGWPDWVEKVLAEIPALEAMIALGATRTLTAQYFEPLLRRADAICVISGRTPFWGIASDTDSPPDGHFLLYFGPHVSRFLEATKTLGAAWVTWRKVA